MFYRGRVRRSRKKEPNLVHVDVLEEREADRGWTYVVRLTDMRPGTSPDSATMTQSKHEVRLDWADHEHWSGGSASPSKVVEAVLQCLLDPAWAGSLPGGGLPAKFDLATARRWVATIDRLVPARLV